jgi:two-component system nitrogen regulation response regulator NtrX
MRRILIADDSLRDAQRFRSLLADDELSIELCSSGAEAANYLHAAGRDLALFIVLWEIPGPPFGSELLLRSKQLLPGVPVVIISDALNASIATYAFALGARDFLEKPLDMQRVKSCLDSLLNEQDPYSPLVEQLNKTILGNSAIFRSTLKQVAKVIPHTALRVLLIGESGTGKDVLARAFHELGANPTAPFVHINIAAIPKELIESALFGHEKGAFTGATNMHRGYMEEACYGTLFLDELGELDLSLQAKLLRAIQDKKFRRLKGIKDIDFNARLVCATNRDLTLMVKQGSFRQDLYHRIAERLIYVPPLRERNGDIGILLEHFLSLHSSERGVRFARETLTILHSYPFPGNVRELENFVKQAVIECDGELILPQHLPLLAMAGFLSQEDPATLSNAQPNVSELKSDEAANEMTDMHQKLFCELTRVLPANWHCLPYKQVFEKYEHAFDRIYLPRLIERYHHNVTRATKAAEMDRKTFAQHWKDAGLSPLRAEGEKSNE